MKRWHRITLIAAISLLVIVLGLVGGLMWLQSSGRLTHYAQKLVQAQIGPHLSFDAVAFTSWNVVTLADVRLQQTLPGWQLDVICPRLEARYTLQGLRQKQISAVHLIQPSVHLQIRDTPTPSGATGQAPGALVLPVERIQVRDATLRLDRDNVPYTLKHLQVSVHRLAAQLVDLEAQARLADDAASVHIRGNLSLDLANPRGRFDVRLSQIDVSRLATQGLLPSDWALTDIQGALDVVASKVELRGRTVKGQLEIKLKQGHGSHAAVTVKDVALTTEMAFEATLQDRTVNLQGPIQLQAAEVRLASAGLVASQLTAQLPLQLVYAPGQWHVHTELRLQGEQLKLAAAGGMQLQQLSQTASIDVQSTSKGWSLKGDLSFATPRAAIASIRVKALSGNTPVTLNATPKQWHSTLNLSLKSQTLSANNAWQLQKVSSQLPVDIQSASPGWDFASWRIKGTADVKADRLRVGTAKPVWVLERLQSRLPLHLASNLLTSHDLHVQAKTVRWTPGIGPPITAPLDLRTTVDLDLQHGRLDAKTLVLDLPHLGRIQGRGTWQWTTGVTRDVRLSITPAKLETVWPQVAAILPPPYPTWLVSGQTHIHLHAPRAVWRGGAPARPLALSIDWRFSDIAFSNPEGDVAGENIDGRAKAEVSITPNWRPVSVQGSITLKPFALLVGSFFLELEQHNVVSTLTFSSTYHPKTDHVDLAVDSQFGSLGRVAIKGKIDISQTPLQVDVTCRLRQIDVRRAWQTFMSATLGQAAARPDMQGQLNARLQLRGTLAKARLQGNLQLAAFHLRSGSLALRNLSLQLPVDIRYPLPEDQPNLASLPASAYGQLHLDHIQFGALNLPDVSTKLAVRSDAVIFQKDIHLTLLKGVLHLQDLVAYRVLRPQRQIRLRLRLRSLNLERLPRGDGELPLAGLVDADFSHLQLQHGRLQTEGALQIDVAGGRIRIDDVAGWDLFSQIPSIRSSLKTETPLSLSALTQIYPIGDIGGTLHFTVDDLTITAGEPAAFRLHFHVQEKGGEAREISLEALNNLLFTTGSARVASRFAETFRYRRFGADITLQHDTLRLRGLYKDRKGREYFMRPPVLGNGVSIANPVPKNGTPFRHFVQRLTSTVLKGPNVDIQ